MNINVSMSAAPKQALVPASRYFSYVTSPTTMSVSSFIRIERGTDGYNNFKFNKVPFLLLNQ